MLTNVHYENDVEYTVKLNRFIFRLLGVWPYMKAQPSPLESFKSVSLILICYFLLYVELIPMILYIIYVEKRLHVRLKIVSSAMFTTLAVMKYSSMVLNKQQIKSCLMWLKDDWRKMMTASARDFMLKRARTARHIFILCSIFMYSAGFYFRIVVPLSKGKHVTDQNVTIRYLASPGYFVFFDGQISPVYEIMFCIQFLAGFVKYTITVAICSLAALFTMHTCAQLDILMALMNDLVDLSDNTSLKKRLAMIVEYQIRTRSFLQLVQNTLEYANLFEVLGCTLIICLLGHDIITVRLNNYRSMISNLFFMFVYEWEDQNVVVMCSYMILLTSIGFNIFIFCFIGEQLSTEGEKLALTVCTLNWYRLPDAKARELVLVIAISYIPTKLRAGKFIDLSIRTFGDVVKTALAYFNFLRNVMK